MRSMDKDSRPVPARPTRRAVLLGATAASTAWAAPAVLGVDRAAAAPFSCVDQTIAWNSVVGSNPYTATASSGSITITAAITANFAAGGTPACYLSGGRVIQGMSNHSINDFWDTTLTFTDSAGTICQATTTILDIDRNDRGLGCPALSRFNDQISNLAGAGLALTTQGGLVQTSPGVYSSSLNCKTGDTENLVMTWTVGTGVLNGGFRWTALAPTNGSTTLDFQLIKLTPFVVCATVPSLAAAASATAARGAGPGGPSDD